MINAKRPNTAVDDSFLVEDVIICCGEDSAELTSALQAQFEGLAIGYHEYRCYRFWKFKRFTLIWTGIGTGCLEPLLYEILPGTALDNVILIGTSGSLPGKGIGTGEVFIAEKAYLGGSALQLPEHAFPLCHNFCEQKLSSLGMKRRTTISTDFYYAFDIAPPAAIQGVVDEDVRLKRDLALYWDKAESIDMEVGQFYYLCQILRGKSLHYVALKGAANPVDASSQQTLFSGHVLYKTLDGALRLLGIPHELKPGVGATVKAEASIVKLTEEIKLFWTIQVGVCAVLGYLGTTMDFNSNYAKTLLVSVIAFLLLLIGSVYNLVANYYIRLSGFETEGKEQEDIVTPTLGKVYLIISGLVGAIAAYSVVHLLAYIRLVDGVPPYRFGSDVVGVVSGILLGTCLNYRQCRRVLQYLCSCDTSERYSGTYSDPIRRVYCHFLPKTK